MKNEKDRFTRSRTGFSGDGGEEKGKNMTKGGGRKKRSWGAYFSWVEGNRKALCKESSRFRYVLSGHLGFQQANGSEETGNPVVMSVPPPKPGWINNVIATPSDRTLPLTLGYQAASPWAKGERDKRARNFDGSNWYDTHVEMFQPPFFTLHFHFWKTIGELRDSGAILLGSKRIIIIHWSHEHLSCIHSRFSQGIGNVRALEQEAPGFTGNRLQQIVLFEFEYFNEWRARPCYFPHSPGIWEH